MGLLADWYANKRADDKAQQAQSLMERLYGNKGTPSVTSYPYNDGQAGAGITQRTQGGSGLLGGQTTQPQFDAQLNSGLAGIYGAQGLMQSRNIQSLSGRQAQERQQQAQDYYSGNQTLDQQMRMQQQQQQYQQGAGIAAFQNQQAQGNTLFDDQLGLVKAYSVEVKPYREGLDRYESTMNTIKDMGGLQNLNAYQQLAMIVDYSKLAKPGEQLTEGEYDTVMKQGGMPGLVGMYAQLLQGKGTMQLSQLKQLQNAMQTMARTRQGQVGRINKQYDKLASDRGLSSIRREPAQFESAPSDPGMPDDVVPIQ